MEKTNSNKKTNRRLSPLVKWFWILFAGGVGSVLLLFLSASLGLLGEMPDFKHLENRGVG